MLSIPVLTPLWQAAIAAVVLNIPFGFWRAGARKFSPVWFLAVHLPVPLVVGLRLFLHLGWQLSTFPVLISAYFLGQFCGGRFRLSLRQRKAPQPSDS